MKCHLSLLNVGFDKKRKMLEVIEVHINIFKKKPFLYQSKMLKLLPATTV